MKNERMRWVGHVARMAAKINSYNIFIAKPEGRILIYLFIYLLSFTFHRSLGINPLDIGIVIYKQKHIKYAQKYINKYTVIVICSN